MSDTPQLLLTHHLKALKLATFLREYDKLAQQCAAEGVDHPRYLLRLAELELIERERRMVERRIKQARFPTVKSLDSFDFTAIPSLNKTLVLELARCEYLARRENAIAVGNSGTGKTHIALGLGLAACQKGLSVGFTTAAALVHELIEARDDKRLLRLQGVTGRFVQNRTRPLSTKDSDSGLDGDAAEAGSPDLSTDGGAEDPRQLQSRRHPGPQGFGLQAATPVASDDLAFGDALRPAKADFVKIEVGMLGADVMKDAGHRALHPQIEPLDRVGVNRATNIFAAPMLNGLMRCKTLTDRNECLPLVAHQGGPSGRPLSPSTRSTSSIEEIGNHRGPGIAGRRAGAVVLGR